MTIEAFYPQWKVGNPDETAMAWHWALEDYPSEGIMAALQVYIKTNNTGFAPSVAQLIGAYHAPQENATLTEGEAWALIKKAIQDANYHAEERFEELPPLCQRAVGSPTMLRQWAQCDSDTVNTVIMSNVQRTYKAIAAKQEFNDKVPPKLTAVIQGVCNKLEDKGGV